MSDTSVQLASQAGTIKRLERELAALKRTTQLISFAPFTDNQIDMQSDVVRSAYNKDNDLDQKRVYKFEGLVLHNMKQLNAADNERRLRCLPMGSKTNHCL